MAKMLRADRYNPRDFGCCDMCSRGKPLHLKPGPRERHVARQREKLAWKRAANREQD